MNSATSRLRDRSRPAFSALAAIIFVMALVFPTNAHAASRPKVLVFSKTTGSRHTSIPFGIAAVDRLGAENRFDVDHSESATDFTEKNLARYRAVIFLNTTGNILNAAQQNAFEHYIEAGGGFVGIHAAADTEYEWPWYEKLLGAHFTSHPEQPNVRTAQIQIIDRNHPATAPLPDRWERTDEWYNYRSIYPGIHVLASLDEETYEGGTNGSNHPISWYHEFDGGRAFYTGGGHQDSSFSEPLFLRHLLGGIQYAMGDGTPLDFVKAHSSLVPEENRFEKTVLIDHLASPMELAIANDGRVFFSELGGKVQVYTPATNRVKVVGEVPVSRSGGTGLIGITLDPHFDTNHFLYLYHSLPTDTAPIYFHLSRYTLTETGAIDLASEKVLLEIPVARLGGGHHGGSMAWDEEGNLFLSTGDSSAPHPSDGFAPLDERPTPESRDQDSQRSAANTDDLKGKILRITPQPDGTYTIPSGNLFPQGTALTRPEIYVMGVRNPYRIAVNPRSSVLYWGDIGPDAGFDTDRGPRGYDEFNQALRAGNFGWPYFIGPNLAYSHWDFATAKPGPQFSVTEPRNDSPNNTGLKILPPPQPAMVWYPYAGSKEFPELGEGGRCAMAGEFYHYDSSRASPRAIPQYFDGALFVFDWMRNWMMALRVDENDRFIRMEPFMASNGDFHRPIDQAFSRDGLMYVLEYGSIYGADNDDARLVRIEYNAGNRLPKAQAGIRDVAAEQIADERSFLTSDHRIHRKRLREIAGPVPLTVVFSGQGTDPDDDDHLRYEWIFESGKVGATTADATHTFTTPGVYQVQLLVIDQSGEIGTDEVLITAGNARPVVEISTPANKSFFWENETFPYSVHVFDRDGSLDSKKIDVRFRYDPQPTSSVKPLGAELIAASDCRACHTLDKPAMGPAFLEISKRYHDQPAIDHQLAEKIIKGGGGNWGTQFVMAGHPQIPIEDAKEIVRYILSLGLKKGTTTAQPAEGILALDQHKPGEAIGRYTLVATYEDGGSGAAPSLTGTDQVSLRSATVPTEYVDAYPGFNRWGSSLAYGGHKAHLYLRDIDLTGIGGFTFKYTAPKPGEIEVRQHSFNGPVISRISFPVTGPHEAEVTASLNAPLSDRCDLYFIMRQPNPPNTNVITVKSIHFDQRKTISP